MKKRRIVFTVRNSDIAWVAGLPVVRKLHGKTHLLVGCQAHYGMLCGVRQDQDDHYVKEPLTCLRCLAAAERIKDAW